MNTHTSTKPLFKVWTRLVKKIDEYEKRISKIEEDICGVRRIIGVSKEFQDWRALTSDVETLKKKHVGKDLFESEVKRLDQRIDALKEVKFWSKRTFLEIILAIWGTIVTLYASGVLRF